MTDSGTVMISIVAACRNEAAHIGPFLESLLAQDLRGLEWEAIIADGMSEDGTRAVLEECAAGHPELRVIANPGRIVSTGLNAAIRAARGDVILRMDAHTRYATDYCRRCVETLLRTGADNVGGPARTDARGIRASAIAAAYHSPFSTGGARFHDLNYEGWVDTVPYGCWRKDTLFRLGLFDETLIRNQDDELNLRLVRSGGRIWQNPEIVSWYSPRASLSGLCGQYFQYGFWKVAVIRKHRLPASWRHVVPVVFVLGNVMLILAMAASAGWLADWFGTVATLWLAAASTYMGAIVIASVAIARTHDWRILPHLPLVFATYHFAYGLGFLFNLVSSRRGSIGKNRSESLLTRITR
jgi:succinoglycan biosynthesis protein ExoA